MTIRNLGDVYSAVDAGRIHIQRFYKTASTTGDGQWIDWAYASGQPAYDARIGTALAFNPFVASRNDAIYFPGIDSAHERRILEITLHTIAGGASQATLSAQVYDLLGVYPLIDGDSTDEQLLDNALTLPRYADGAGVVAVLVNHVAPMLAAANGVMTYVDAAGVDRTSSIRVALTGQNKAASAIAGGGGAGAACPLGMGTVGGGVRRINSIQFAAAPGGLFAVYLLKPLMTIHNNDGLLTAEKTPTEKAFTASGLRMPRVYDGAHLGFFIMPNGGGRSVSMFGDITFIWG